MQPSSARFALVLVSAALASAVGAAQSNDFISTWKSPGAGPIDFAGRKVATVLIADDDHLRVSTEEALAREIEARGSTGVPAYRIIPREELASADSAKGWFERAGVAGLVILRLAKTDTTRVYSSALWVSGYYNYAWDYWGYGWANVYPLGEAREQKTITVEILLYDLSNGRPMWAGVSRTTDPKDVQSYVTRLSADVVKRLEKDGLVKKRR